MLFEVEQRDAKLVGNRTGLTPLHKKSHYYYSIHFDSSHGSDGDCAAFDGDNPGKIVRRWDSGFAEFKASGVASPRTVEILS